VGTTAWHGQDQMFREQSIDQFFIEISQKDTMGESQGGRGVCEVIENQSSEVIELAGN